MPSSASCAGFRRLGVSRAGGPSTCTWGGWRPHSDVDLVIFRENQRAIHEHSAGRDIRKVVRGEFHDWVADEWLALPIHEIHVQSGNVNSKAVEFLLNDRNDDTWVYRRNPGMTRPVEQVMQSLPGGLSIDRRWLKDALATVHDTGVTPVRSVWINNYAARFLQGDFAIVTLNAM